MKQNNEQQEATNIIGNWINSPPKSKDDLFFTLSGYAGTGKSTTVNDIIKNVRQVVVSAPTHKAKRVIQDKTNKAGETIQGLLGLRPDTDIDNFNPNKPTFNIKAEEKIQDYKLVVIDECSMLNKGMVTLITEKAIKYNTKVLLVGDKLQLPPIKEKISIAFDKKNLYNLQTIVRQEYDNPNTKLIELSRNDILNGTNTLDKYISSIKQDIHGETGFKVLPKEKFYPQLLEYYYNSEYKYNPDFAKTICWTNNTVSAINNFIRNKIIASKELVEKGDMLMGYNNISLQIDGPPYFIPLIANSEDYIVEEVELTEYYIEGILFKGYKTKLLHRHNDLFILHPNSYKDFVVEYLRRLDEARTYKKWTAFYRFKNQIHLIQDLREPNTNSLICNKDIDYAYAISTHKSQGSTYENVGVILGDINQNMKVQERKQLKYVAISRTSKTNTLYG